MFLYIFLAMLLQDSVGLFCECECITSTEFRVYELTFSSSSELCTCMYFYFSTKMENGICVQEWQQDNSATLLLMHEADAAAPYNEKLTERQTFALKCVCDNMV